MTLIDSLTGHLDADDRERALARLRNNQLAWFTTVRPDGRPDSVPVWFLLLPDGTVRVYSQPSKRKLANIAANPHVALGMDVTDLGRDVVRLTGTARIDEDAVPADEDPAFVAKYAERLAVVFGTPEAFAKKFSVALTITPDRVLA